MEDSKSEKIALFRYGLIATLVLEKLSRGELMRRARELAKLHYQIPFSCRTTVSVETLLIDMGPSLSPRRFGRLGCESAVRPGTEPGHRSTTGSTHRTSQT